MVLSHYTLDRLSPINQSESGVRAGGGQVGPIRVQPHRVSKCNKPILDYDSNEDFEDEQFVNSDTPTPGQAPAIQHFDEFISQDGYENDTNVNNNSGRQIRIYDNVSVAHDQGFVDKFTIVTKESSGKLSRLPGDRHGMSGSQPLFFHA